ncbi:hypothetical protein Kim5_PA00332 (plasmid) [Rhizobium sp. Kim5]|nr:hypothetical protein Kim5_PA00332 [Rhizobium sp. Kim5]
MEVLLAGRQGLSAGTHFFGDRHGADKSKCICAQNAFAGREEPVKIRCRPAGARHPRNFDFGQKSSVDFEPHGDLIAASHVIGASRC